MSQIAKLFKNGRSQAVRLPAAFRFDGDKVYVRRDPTSGDVILSAQPRSLGRFFAALAEGRAPEDFLSHDERNQEPNERDPLDGWDK
jgi:antitoxin VapB